MTLATKVLKTQLSAMDESSAGLPYSGARSVASQLDLMDEVRFEKGCRLLMLIARTRDDGVEDMLDQNPDLANFRDYDRRTPLHVASSEGKVEVR